MTQTLSTDSKPAFSPNFRVRQGVIHTLPKDSQHIEITWDNGAISEITLQSLGVPSVDDLWKGARLSAVDILGDNRDVKSTLLVLEPEYVVDVTEVAETMFGEKGLAPEIALLHRFKSRQPSRAMLSGTLVNSVFDLLVADPSVADSDLIDKASAGRPLAWAMMEHQGQSVLDVHQSVADLIPRLRSALESMAIGEILVEPYVVSPQLGLQGRFDVLIRGNKGSRLIEMKAGKAPSTIRPSHRAQAAAYALLHLAAVGTLPTTTEVWYVAADRQPFREITRREILHTIQQLILARNAIVAIDRALANRQFSSLKKIHAAIPHASSFDKADAEAFSDAYRDADVTGRTIFQAWLAFIHAERWTMRHGTGKNRSRAELWRSPLHDKEEDPACITDLRLVPEASDMERMHLEFESTRSIADCSLRPGDLVVLHEGVQNNQAAVQILKGTLDRLGHNRVGVVLRNKQASAEHLATATWVVETDVSESTLRNVVPGVLDVLTSPQDRRNALLGLREPRFGAQPAVSSADLSDDQREIVARALSAEDYFLIQGPPGTGKTSVILRTIVTQLLADPNERVLVVAYTNRAVNEICQVLDSHLPSGSYLRHGSQAGVVGSNPDHAIPVLGQRISAEQLAERLVAARCIVSTIHSVHSTPEIHQFGAFTTAVVDEASQVLEPNIIGILAGVRRSILIGDHFQLPPVVSQSPEQLQVRSSTLASIGCTHLGITTFERLHRLCTSKGWQGALATLTRQGRMHQDVMAFPSAAFYNGQLRTLAPWQEDPSPLPWSSIIPERSMFVPVQGNDHQAEAEVNTIVELVTKIDAAAAKSGYPITIGVITPFRVQNRSIALRLPPELHAQVTVDTVERFQGSQRDVIIYGTAVGNSVELRNIRSDVEVEGLMIDRKFNVACTRARQQFVLVGQPDVLKEAPAYANAITVLTWLYVTSTL